MKKNFEHASRCIWLIGASSGIGKALAEQLARRGYKVAISSRNETALQEMHDKQHNLAPYPLDATNPESLHRAYSAIRSTQGEVQTVFYNAGDYNPMPIDEYDPELFRKMIEVNYMGAVYLLDVLLPEWTERGYGQILLTTSLAAYRGLPRSAPYSASKAALLNFAESLHLEMKAKGVDLRVINPGFVRTPLTAKNRFRMPSLIEPDEAADAIIDNLNENAFEIRFPRGFALLMNLLRVIPYRWYFSLTRRAL